MSGVEFIAEIGSSHKKDINRALGLISAAAHAGANTVKFQFWRHGELWRADDERQAATNRIALPQEWLKELHAFCNARGVEFLCTPFSLPAVEILDQYVKRWKVASGDITYIPMLRRIAATKKPVLLSVGFSTNDEIDAALKTLRPNRNCSDITLLHCVGDYPTKPEDANIKRVLDLLEMSIHRGTRVGLSSHLRAWWVDVAAAAYGATVFEKHIDAEALDGPEAGHSLTPKEFAQFIQAVRDVRVAMYVPDGFCPGDEYARKHYRRDPSDWLRPVKA